MTNNIPATNPTPGQRFRADVNKANAHRELVQMPGFISALEVGLLEYQRRLAATTEAQLAAPAFFKLQGAQEFVSVVRNLAENQQEVVYVDKDNLRANRH